LESSSIDHPADRERADFAVIYAEIRNRLPDLGRSLVFGDTAFRAVAVQVRILAL